MAAPENAAAWAGEAEGCAQRFVEPRVPVPGVSPAPLPAEGNRSTVRGTCSGPLAEEPPPGPAPPPAQHHPLSPNPPRNPETGKFH